MNYSLVLETCRRPFDFRKFQSNDFHNEHGAHIGQLQTLGA